MKVVAVAALAAACAALALALASGGTDSKPARAPAATRVASPLSTSSTCADWYAAATRERKAFAATIKPTVTMQHPVPTDPDLAEAYMYGFVSGQCDRAKKAGRVPADVPMSRVLAADFSPKS